MAGESNPFAKYVGTGGVPPVERPEPIVRPGEMPRSAKKAGPTRAEPVERAPIVAPAPAVAPEPAESNPFNKYTGRGSITHATEATAPVAAPAQDIDLSGSYDAVRARIAGLPVAERKKALDAWADVVVAKERDGGGTMQTLNDYARRAAMGVVGGWGDRLGATIASKVGGADYEEALAKEQATSRAAVNNTSAKLGTLPTANLPIVGEVGGDVTTGGVAGFAGGAAGALAMPIARVANAIPGLRSAPNSIISNMVNMGANGAAYGGVIGYGSGNTDEEREANAAHGAKVGGVIGAGLVPVARGVAAGAARVADAATALPAELRGYSRNAVDKVSTAFEHDNPQMTMQYGPEGMLADMGENLRNTAGGLASIPGPNMQAISQAVTGRRMGAAGRISADVDATLGPAQNLVALEEQVMSRAQQAARPLYDQFYNTPIPMTPRLQDLLNRADAAGVMPNVVRLMQMEGINPNQLGSNGRLLDLVKRGIDDMARDAAPGSNVQRVTSNLARDLRTEVDNIIAPPHPQTGQPDPARGLWAQARRASGEGLQFREGLKEGGEAFSKGTHPDQMAADLAGASAPYEAGFVAGGRGQIRDIMGNAAAAYGRNGDIASLKALNADYAQQKFNSLVGPQQAGRLSGRLNAEAAFNRTYEDVLRNSKTAVRQAVQKGLPNVAEDAGAKLHNVTLEGMVLGPVRKLVDVLSSGFLSERNMRTVRDMADMLVQQGMRREEIASGLRQYIARSGVNGRIRGQIDRVITHVLRGTIPSAVATKP